MSGRGGVGSLGGSVGRGLSEGGGEANRGSLGGTLGRILSGRGGVGSLGGSAGRTLSGRGGDVILESLLGLGTGSNVPASLSILPAGRVMEASCGGGARDSANASILAALSSGVSLRLKGGGATGVGLDESAVLGGSGGMVSLPPLVSLKYFLSGGIGGGANGGGPFSLGGSGGCTEAASTRAVGGMGTSSRANSEAGSLSERPALS